MPVATTDAFRRITVQPDNVTVVAEQVGDTLTLVAGSGISLVANTTSDQITIVNTNPAQFSLGIAGDDSSIKTITSGETIKLSGAGTVTTGADAEGNITITGTSTPTSVVTSNITVSGVNAYTLTPVLAATPLTITVTPQTTTSLVTVTFQFTWHPSEPEASGSTGMELYIYKDGVQQASSQYIIFTSGNGDSYNSYPVHYSWPNISGTTSPITYTVYASKTGGNGGTIGTAPASKFPCWATVIG
jgi:hypothetical protein